MVKCVLEKETYSLFWLFSFILSTPVKSAVIDVYDEWSGLYDPANTYNLVGEVGKEEILSFDKIDLI